MLLQYLLLALFFVTFTAPEESQSSGKYLVTEIADRNTYNLTIRLDGDREADLLACMEKLTDLDLSAPDAKAIFAERDGVSLTYLSHRHMLVVSTVVPSRDNADRAHRIAEELKDYLDIRVAGTTGRE